MPPFNLIPVIGKFRVGIAMVEPGTAIEKDGAQLIVDDTQMVSKDGTFYVTSRQLGVILARTDSLQKYRLSL